MQLYGMCIRITKNRSKHNVQKITLRHWLAVTQTKNHLVHDREQKSHLRSSQRVERGPTRTRSLGGGHHQTAQLVVAQPFLLVTGGVAVLARAIARLTPHVHSTCAICSLSTPPTTTRRSRGFSPACAPSLEGSWHEHARWTSC